MPDSINGTISAVDGIVDLRCDPDASLLFTVRTTSDWVGTLILEATHTLTGFGTPHYARLPFRQSNGDASNAEHTAANTTVTYMAQLSGYREVRVRASAWTAGTATVAMITSIHSMSHFQAGALPGGSNTLGHVTSGGAIGHDAVDSGNPLSLGAHAVTPSTGVPETRVSADADRGRLAATRDGQLYVQEGFPQGGDTVAVYAAAQTATVLVAAPAAGLSIHLLGVVASANGAVNFTLHDEDDVTVFPVLYANAAGWLGGASGIKKKLTAAKALEVTTTAAVAHSIQVFYGIGP